MRSPPLVRLGRERLGLSDFANARDIEPAWVGFNGMAWEWRIRKSCGTIAESGFRGQQASSRLALMALCCRPVSAPSWAV